MAFDIASVKLGKSGLPSSVDRSNSSVLLGPRDVYAPKGGRFTATNFPLATDVGSGCGRRRIGASCA